MKTPGPLPAGWIALDNEGNSQLNDEIASEAVPGHPLYGEPFRSVARGIGSDDVIVELSPKIAGAWAIVHPTYQVETDPRWPSIDRYDTWEQMVEAANAMAEGWDTGE